MASEFSVRFDCDDDAFHPEPGPEIARILRVVADRMEAGEDASRPVVIRDINGNVVGTYKLTDP
ncbi:MAG TPA: hypothetical protein VG476_02465 [Acidimicrobiales bacterium]|nr:hypothetical protein [Acidimicrobiales bacterium]